jgi:ABC-type microcin C transport system permease subunit YejB
MFRFVLRRFCTALPVLLVAVTATFMLIRMAPGGPFTAERNYTEESLARLRGHAAAASQRNHTAYCGRAARVRIDADARGSAGHERQDGQKRAQKGEPT